MTKYEKWLDLAVCSAWMLMCLGRRMYSPVDHIVFIAAVSRIVFAFVLYRREIRSCVPLLLSVVAVWYSASSGNDVRLVALADTMSHVFGLPFDNRLRMAVILVLGIWIWIVPVVMYIVLLLGRRLSRTELRWKDVLGAIMWNDHSARTYSLLMLVAVGTLFSGLAMDARMCLFVCLTAPVLSYRILMRHYVLSSGNIAVMVAGMLMFYYAQPTSGVWRICLLVMSIAVVANKCIGLYLFRGRLLMFFLSVLYIAILLPSLSIGYNQYVCLDFGRYYYHTLEPYQGIFYVKDNTGEKIGLRDRYGLLVRPEYDRLVYHDRHHWMGELELHRNGYYTLYDICDNTFRQDDDIRHGLQDSICRVVDKHLTDFSYEYDEGLEVRVTESVSGKVISHVQMSRNGPSLHYYTGSEPYIMADSVAVRSGEFVCDSLVIYEGRWGRKGLSHSCDVLCDTTASYNIFIHSARNNMPCQKELQRLATVLALILEDGAMSAGEIAGE